MKWFCEECQRTLDGSVETCPSCGTAQADGLQLNWNGAPAPKPAIVPGPEPVIVPSPKGKKK